MNDDASFLEGQLLIAMPGMGDRRFDRSVVFVCSHSEEGAMGLIINKPVRELSFAELLTQLDIEVDASDSDRPVFFGGPVEHGRGFVLHSNDYQSEGATMSVDGGFGMTATLDVLRDLANGKGPRSALLALGYAGWSSGQLESEIRANGWLAAPADDRLVFDTPPDDAWTVAMQRIGIDPRLLSGDGGRA
ncbi:MAG: YqgE/AlgH family protein [Pseudomonadota bacterium]